MCHGRIGFPLLGEHPAQFRLRFSILGSKLHCFFEFGASSREIARLKRLLTALKSQTLGRVRRRGRHLRGGGTCYRKRCEGQETDEPKGSLEHDEWGAIFFAL
jgi:hypothetical protein